jgi:predicted O-methyltransferase YrrM
VNWDHEQARLRSAASPSPRRLYEQALAAPSDIREHLPALHKYASAVRSVTEFGTRTGNSTAAFLFARPECVTAYDIVRHAQVAALEAAARLAGVRFQFFERNIRTLSAIDPTDLLFLDSVHTYEQVQFELGFAPDVRRYIILHDTETFGTVGEDRGEGIWRAVSEFLRGNPGWELHAHDPRNNGLTILRRRQRLNELVPPRRKP